jgi:hypothetical protein
MSGPNPGDVDADGNCLITNYHDGGRKTGEATPDIRKMQQPGMSLDHQALA